MTWVKDQLRTKGQQWKEVLVRSDSMSAIQSLTASTITSGLVLEIKKLIDVLKGEIKIAIEWVKTHEGTVGNEIADILAKRGTVTVTQGCEPWLPVSNDSIKNSITSHIYREWQKLWNREGTCKLSSLTLTERS